MGKKQNQHRKIHPLFGTITSVKHVIEEDGNKTIDIGGDIGFNLPNLLPKKECKIIKMH
jgi:hypothetical protein